LVNLKEGVLRKHKHKWEDNIKVKLQEIGWEGVKEMYWFRIGISGGIL
jgi:hypothetical protein